MWSGGPDNSLRNFHVTELGCGAGANLISFAYYHPEVSFFGIDNSDTELECATRTIQILELNNIQFTHRDVRDLKTSDISQSDYIIAHGIYSWIPDDARGAILSFCAHNLKSAGLAYISYNV